MPTKAKKSALSLRSQLKRLLKCDSTATLTVHYALSATGKFGVLPLTSKGENMRRGKGRLATGIPYKEVSSREAVGDKGVRKVGNVWLPAMDVVVLFGMLSSSTIVLVVAS